MFDTPNHLEHAILCWRHRLQLLKFVRILRILMLDRDKWLTDRLIAGRDIDYVEWYDEPHHKSLWKNEYTNIHIATVPPGSSTVLFEEQLNPAFLGTSQGVPCMQLHVQ